VIHDLNFTADRSFLPFHIRLFYTYLFPKYAQKATRIATVSQFSKRDLQKTYGVPSDKIDVVYNGVGLGFQPLEPEKIREVRRRISNNHPYFLIVGSIHPRKNLANQLRAFRRFQISGTYPAKLVIVGEMKWGGHKIARLIRRCGEDNVKVLGSVSNEELVLVVGSAAALCYVSFYEGFGTPPIEAMRAGVPVITSAATAMPEICGDSAVLVNPRSVDEIHRAMVEIVGNENLRQSLINRGFERSHRYSWDRTAALLWESIERALNLRSAET
jgi:glycosyltransferase involved in cell wall biosynthesis